MKDLIKEIEKLKRPDTKISFDEGFNKGINKCFELLTQHNIITAPKQIKLSEVVSRLNVNDWKDFQVSKQENVISIDNNNCFREYLNIDNNKIVDISTDMQVDKFKWLYALWIAGSEIIDDIGEENNEI